MKSRKRSVGSASGAALQADGHGAGNEALARRVHAVEQLVEALSLQLGERLTHGLADEASAVEQPVVGLVDKLEDVLGAGEDRDEAWRLLEKPALPLGLGRAPPLGEHGLRGLGADDEDAADAVRRRLVVDRAVAVGPVDLVQPAEARDRHGPVLVPGRAAARHDEVHLMADQVPDLRPDLAARLAERPRVALRAERAAVGVVVEAEEVRTPPDVHGVPGVEDEADGGLQRPRPSLGRAQRRRGPVVRAHERAHLATAG